MGHINPLYVVSGGHIIDNDISCCFCLFGLWSKALTRGNTLFRIIYCDFIAVWYIYLRYISHFLLQNFAGNVSYRADWVFALFTFNYSLSTETWRKWTRTRTYKCIELFYVPSNHIPGFSIFSTIQTPLLLRLTIQQGLFYRIILHACLHNKGSFLGIFARLCPRWMVIPSNVDRYPLLFLYIHRNKNVGPRKSYERCNNVVNRDRPLTYIIIYYIRRICHLDTRFHVA